MKVKKEDYIEKSSEKDVIYEKSEGKKKRVMIANKKNNYREYYVKGIINEKE